MSTEHDVNGCVVVAKAEFEGFLQVTAVKTFQFVKHSAHWIESIFWIVLLVGATALAIRDVRKAYQQFTDEETYTSMRVTGLQTLTFDDAIVCVEYDPRAVNLTNSRVLSYAEMSSLKSLANKANTSAVILLNRLLKLITAISLIEHGRSADYEKKLRELQRGDDLQQLQDWLIKQGVDMFDISKEVGNWLCNSFRLHIDTIKRGVLLSSVNPCIPQKISWLGVIPFASIASSETAFCVDIRGQLSFASMFDKVVISANRENVLLPSDQDAGYVLNLYVDISGDPVSTDMTKDFVAFPNTGCQAFEIGLDAKLRLIDRWIARCNTTAKTRFKCYADCDIGRYAGTKLSNCTQLAWRQLFTSKRTMCFDLFTVEEHVDIRPLLPTTNVSSTCFTSCLFPCEYRQYDINVATDECYKDYANAKIDGVSVDLHPKRFSVPVFEEHFSVGISELLSRIGGTCGLWLGVGLLGICHALLFPLKLLAKLFIRWSCSKHAVPAEITLAVRG